jgi:hypothetical protein
LLRLKNFSYSFPPFRIRITNYKTNQERLWFVSYTITMKATCPVCNEEIILEENGKAFLQASKNVSWFLTHEQLLDAVIKGNVDDPILAREKDFAHKDKIHWACDKCLEKGKAILADPTQQTFVDFVPYYAYFDRKFQCRKCGKLFTFSANEQRYWFETLKFWVQSYPKDCIDCRRRKREAKKQSKNE